VAYLSRFIQSPNGQVPAGLLLPDESRPLLIGLQFVLPPHLLQRRGWKARSSKQKGLASWSDASPSINQFLYILLLE
jgi:hypothetical protein